MTEASEFPAVDIDHPQDLRAIVHGPETGEPLLMIVYTGTATFSLGSLGDDASFGTVIFPVPNHNGNCQAYPSPLQVRASVAVGALTSFDADGGGPRACDWVKTELRTNPRRVRALSAIRGRAAGGNRGLRFADGVPSDGPRAGIPRPATPLAVWSPGDPLGRS